MTADHLFHVYDCACVTKIEKIRQVGHTSYTTASPILAVHPTITCVLSESFRSMLVLLDWDLGWKVTQGFYTFGGGVAVAFNPGDDNSFVAGFEHGKVQVCPAESLLLFGN